MDTIVYKLFVIRPVCSQAVNRLLNLCVHCFGQGIVTDPGFGECCGFDFATLRSTLKWSFLQVRRFDLPCVRTFHSPLSSIFKPVLSMTIGRFLLAYLGKKKESLFRRRDNVL